MTSFEREFGVVRDEGRSIATIFVCTSCRRPKPGDGEGFDEPGRPLLEALTRRIGELAVADVKVEPVECLAVCKRPCTIALVADDKWTYLIGDLDETLHVDEILAAAGAFARSQNGIVPWKERPATFRKGVIARVPPIGFARPAPETSST